MHKERRFLVHIDSLVSIRGVFYIRLMEMLGLFIDMLICSAFYTSKSMGQLVFVPLQVVLLFLMICSINEIKWATSIRRGQTVDIKGEQMPSSLVCTLILFIPYSPCVHAIYPYFVLMFLF